MKRYADTFFRYWIIAILPILVLPIGSFFLIKSPMTAYGVANIWVDQTSLQQLAYVDPGASPAQNVANYLTQLLLSPSFDWRTVQNDSLYLHSIPAGVSPKAAVAADLGTNTVVTTSGPNLVSISYTTKNPATATQVVQDILQEIATETAQLAQQQASKNIAYAKKQLKNAQARYTTSALALGKYMSARHIIPSQLDLRQLSDPKLAALYQSVQIAQAAETNAQQQLSAATTQQQQVSRNSFRVIDPPSDKVAVKSRSKQLIGLAIPFALGLILSAGFIVLRTFQDRSLRYAEDVPELLGLPVLTVLPYSPVLAANSSGSTQLLLSAGREN